MDNLLRPNQTGFRQMRSIASQILALRRIMEELINHQKEGVVIFVNLQKELDSIRGETMFSILLAFGISLIIVEATKTMYIDNQPSLLLQTV